MLENMILEHDFTNLYCGLITLIHFCGRNRGPSRSI